MALYAILFLLGAVTVVIVVLTGMRLASRHAVTVIDPRAPVDSSTNRREPPRSGIWSAHVGSVDESARSADYVEVPIWKQHLEAARAGDPGIYKTRRSTPKGVEHWDPYAESQSTASRAKAARRKPRPHRSPHPAEFSESHNGEIDAYSLLGVSRVASAEEIERAYRRRVSSIHPDKFHGDPIGQQDAAERLKQLNLAMKVVRDRLSRAERESGEVPS